MSQMTVLCKHYRPLHNGFHRLGFVIFQAQQESVASKKAEIDELANQVQKLLESRPKGDKSELQQQQYQQLRIASSDLKATNEKVLAISVTSHVNFKQLTTGATLQQGFNIM